MDLVYKPLWPAKTDYAIEICEAGGIVSDAHLPAYRKAGFRIESIYDVDQYRAEEAAARFEIPSVCDSLSPLAKGVNIVDVEVPAWENERVVEELTQVGVAGRRLANGPAHR